MIPVLTLAVFQTALSFYASWMLEMDCCSPCNHPGLWSFSNSILVSPGGWGNGLFSCQLCCIFEVLLIRFSRVYKMFVSTVSILASLFTILTFNYSAELWTILVSCISGKNFWRLLCGLIWKGGSWVWCICSEDIFFRNLLIGTLSQI